MKTLFITLLSLISIHSFAQSNYDKAMSEALKTWGTGNMKDATAQFERIAQAEQDNWIPRYYQALTLISNSFSVQDETEKANMLKKIQSLIPTEKVSSEWLVLRAMASISDMMSDPMSKAMLLSPSIISDYETAIQLDSNNPRAILGLAEFQIQSKKYMGGDTKEECESLQKALPLFDAQKSDIPFYPSWGKERAEVLLKTCK